MTMTKTEGGAGRLPGSEDVDKTRVYNQRKYSIGLILQNGAERVIHPGSFALLARDEIEYLASIAPALFEGGKAAAGWRIGALATQLGFVECAQAESLDAEAIRKHLSQRAPQVKAWLGRHHGAISIGRDLRRGCGDGSAGKQAATFKGAHAESRIYPRGMSGRHDGSYAAGDGAATAHAMATDARGR